MCACEWSEYSLLRRLTPPGNLPDMGSWNVVRGAERVPRGGRWHRIWADESSSLSLATGPAVGTEAVFLVDYDKIAQFELSCASREIRVARLDQTVTDNTIEHLLLDQIWPRILAHHGELVLHAAGVSGAAGAILFAGQSGRGKSTLAASLHQRGCDLIGDDALVISHDPGGAWCSPVYRSLRLFPDSAASLFAPSVPRSEVADYTDKENIHLPVPELHDDNHRVAAIFFISPDQAQDCASVVPVAPRDACMRLVEQSFWLDPTDRELTARKLEAASALVNRAPVYQLAYPRDYARLAQVHAAIFAVLK